jgi:hypothetical protein
MSELDGLAQPSLSIGDANLSIGTFSDVPRTREERWRAESGPAIFSPCHLYRYTLSRTWEEELPRLVVIGLNPSTADHRQLDPTLRRVRNFAQAWGLGGLEHGHGARRLGRPRRLPQPRPRGHGDPGRGAREALRPARHPAGVPEPPALHPRKRRPAALRLPLVQNSRSMLRLARG